MDWLFNTHFINNGGAALHLLIWLYRRCKTEKEQKIMKVIKGTVSQDCSWTEMKLKSCGTV
jgi:hypothetical protein